MPRNIDKIIERSKSKKNDDTLQSTSSSRVDRVISESRYKSSVNPDTLYDDLYTVGTRTGEIFGSWQTKETMDNYRPVVQGAYDRVMAHENFRLGAGADLGLPDLSGVAEGFNQLLSGWDDQTDLYGYYQNEDAFNTAVKNSQLSKKFSGLSYGDVQARMRRYSPDSDEYNYLKNYTEYTNLEDFDKAIEATGYDGQEKPKDFIGRVNDIVHVLPDFLAYPTSKIEGSLRKKIAPDSATNEPEMSEAEAYAKALRKERNKWEIDNRFDYHKDVMQSEDFDERSEYKPIELSYDIWNPSSDMEFAYEFINNEENRDYMRSMSSGAGNSSNLYDDKGYALLKEDEKRVFNYWFDYDKEHGTNKAKEFLEDMSDTLDYRRYYKQTERWEKMADNPLGAVAMSLATPITSMAGGISNLIASGEELLTGKEYNPYDIRRTASNFTTDVRGYVSEDIAKATEGADAFGVNVPSFLYNTFMSASDSAVGGKAFGYFNTFIMGSNAYQQKAKELTEAGESDEVVQGNALVAGLLEVGFEYVGFDKLMNMSDSDSFAKAFVNGLKQSGVEGLEELGTEASNMLADYVFRGDRSEFVAKYNDLIARGYTEEEANTMIAVEIATRLGEATFGGMIGAGPRAFATSFSQLNDLSKTGASIREGEAVDDLIGSIEGMSDKEAETYKLYTEYAMKGVNKDNISNAKLGNLYNTMSNEASEGYKLASKDLEKAEGIIDKQNAIIYSDNASDRKKAKASAKLDKAVYAQRDAQFRRFDHAESIEKLAGIDKKIVDKAVEKAEAEKKAKHEAEVKKLSSGVETSVMADTDKAIEIKGMKDSDTLITSDGEVKLKDVKLSDRDADLIVYARGMEASEANLYLEQYNGEENIEEYTNTFSLVTAMAKNNYSEDTLLKAKGSLSTEQFNAIYAATVTEKYREKQRNIDKLNADMAGKMSYKGVIDDSVIDYDNKSTKGKVNWNSLDSRQREAVTFISGFAKATGMNLKFIADGERKGINGSYDSSTNTITIDVYAGIDKAKNAFKDTIIPTMSHETTHWMKEKSPELYRKMGDLIFKTLEAHDKISEVDRVASEVARQKAKGKNITDDGARDEIIARACEDMLKMSEEGKRLFNSLSESEKKTFIDKVKEILANLMEWVDNLLNSYSSDRYEAKVMREYKDTLAELSKMWDEMLVSSVQTNSSMELAGVWGNEVTSIGGRDLSEFSDAVNTDGEELFQYRAMEEDEDIYRNMLLKYKDIIGINVNDIEALFNMIDKALGIIKNNLEALDYGWDTDINDRAFMPVKPNSDSLYQVSLDFSTLCRKRLLQQTIQNTLQEALQKQLSKEEAIAIRDELMKIQEEGKKIEIACALCYVESARMKSPKQINKFLNNRDAIIREFFANRSGGSIKQMVADAEMRARQELARQHPDGYKGKNDIEVDVLTAPKKQLKTKDAQFVRDEGKKAKASYELTAKEQAELDAALELNVSDFTSADGLESLAKNHSDIFDAYVSFVRNATHSKGIEKDTWWRAGDSDLIGDALIANMNKENGLRSQSWSDFQVIHLLDYIAATIELSTKGAKRQSYTKVPDYVKLLGNTGDMINMSLIPERVFNGKLSYDGVEGMAYEIAKQLRDEYHATAGTICIGITNDQIKMLLADKTIDMVIPYHKSSMSQATRKLMHIPTWDDYEDYQQEKKLDDNEAKAQAKRYGVELKMDGNYQKAPKFSEWFNLKEARQIAKMENENPSNTDEQQKYGIMYGGYKAMQNAANNYLKLCAERGLSPKFSHQNADFTGESNYWKLLIDRKMVDNVTGEIIEQKAIKPIFSEKSVLEILNDELERYPQIKKDNDYAASKVVKKFLSGEMKVDKSTLEALKKPVDNVAVLNILESADDAVQNDDRDDVGYHAGDLGKAESLGSQSKDRSTGHFGRGTYFVGDLEKIKHYNRRDGVDAPKHAVDFSDYNLYKIKNDDDGYKLHNQLRILDGGIKEDWINAAADRQFRLHSPLDAYKYAEEKYGEDHYSNEARIYGLKELAKKANIDIQTAEEFSKESGYDLSDEYFESAYIEYLDEKIDEELDEMNDEYREFFDAYDWLEMRFGSNKVKQAMWKTLMYQNANAGNTMDAYKKDSLATVFMKALGYEGVDTRGTSLDNVEYGSVIYDLKENTVLYSDRDDDISVYEKLGELDRVTKERDALIEDMNWLRQRLKLEGKVSDGKYFTDASILKTAELLLKNAESKYNKIELARRLRKLYHGMMENAGKINDEELWNNVLAIATDVASMAKTRIVKNDFALELLKEIKGTRVRFSNKQKAEAKYIFGGNWNRKFYGRIILTDNFAPQLDQQWKEWAEEYPGIFDASVKETNQVEALYEIIDSLRQQSVMVEEYNEGEFITHIATEILSNTGELQPIVTTADKYSAKISAKIKELNDKHKQTISKLRDDYNARVDKAKLAERMFYGRQMNEMRNEHKAKLAEERKKASAKVDEVRAELREDYNARLDERMLAERMHFGAEIAELRRTKKEQVAEAKELGRQKMAEYKENAQKKTKIQSITANVLDLNNKLEINSKDKHIPEAMKDAVGELIRAIDFSSKRLLEGGKPTKNDISIDKALGHLKDAITDGSKEIGDILDEMYGSGVDESIKELVKSVDKHMSMIDGQVFTLNEMTFEELKELDSIIKVIKSTANKLNQFHVAHYNAGVQALGIRSVKDINSRKKIFKDDKKHFEKMKTSVYWNNLNPFYAFKNLGEAAQKIFTALQDGQDKLAFLAKEVIDFTKKVYSQKDYNQWKDKYFTFEVAQPNGKIEKFSMNVPQIMSLYCVSKQEDAKMHILHGDENEEGGGITITETDKKEAKRTNIRLTEADLNNIISKLDDVKNDKGDKTAKGVADELQEYMDRRGAELGNEISMARWGIKSFGITNYFPIKVSEGSVPMKNDTPGVDRVSMLELLNMSFTHARNHFAKQSVEIGDVFDVFSSHMSNMVRYNAMALPILDMYKWMNSRGKDEYGAEYSVQTSIKDTFGNYAWGYFGTLLKDISGGTKKSTRDKLAVRFFKNAKVAKVAGNIRVMAVQFTSFIRAGAVMDNKYLLKSLNYFSTRKLRDEEFKNAIAKAKKYCGIALWKSMGYYDTDITRGLTDQIKHTTNAKDKIVEWTLKGAEWADEKTWGMMWNACEFEIRDTHPELKPRTEEYYKAVGERLRDIIYRTQVVDSMLTRSQMMRSPDAWDKVLTMFGSENALSLNLAMDVFTSYELDKRSMGKEKAKAKNKKYMRKAITAYIVTNVVTSALQTMFDAFRDYDEDEKDEKYWLELMLGNFLSNTSILNKIPYINAFGSIISGFTPSRTDVDWMNDSVKAVKAIYKCFSEGGSLEKAIKYTLKTLSDVSGIAGYNIYRDAMALYELIDGD